MLSNLFPSGKGIALIGNPGVGKTTFLIASIHYLNSIGWAKVKLKELPPEYGSLVDLLVSGKPLTPTINLSEYSLEFSNIEYRGTKLKTGMFGKITFKLVDLSGQDYRRGTQVLAEAVRNVFAALFLIDPTGGSNFPLSLAGQIGPLDAAVRYMLEREKDIRFFGIVFTKRLLHKYDFTRMTEFVEEQLTPILRIIKEHGVRLRFFEVDSRGRTGTLDPEGLEPIYFETLQTVCKIIEGDR